MPTRENARDKLTIREERASVQPANLASEPYLSSFRPGMAPVEVRRFNTCHKRIQGEVSHVELRDPEQFQGFCVRGNETPVTIRENDCVEGIRQKVAHIILTSPMGSQYSSRFEDHPAFRAADGVLRIAGPHRRMP